MILFTRFSLLTACSSLLLLTGCATSFNPSPVQSPVGMIQGRVHGGQPPINGSKVYLLQAGTSGYAGPGIGAYSGNVSTSLLGGTGNADSIGSYVLTDANGFFSLSGKYTCTAGSQVYAYALSGNSGGGTNSGIGLMALLGTCPSDGSLAATVPYLWINEVTTVAAAYAMAGFATDPLHVSIGENGTATAPSAQAVAGIANAFATSNNLVNIATGIALATTPAGNGTAPQAEINTLANILAACVNSTDSMFANCATLFSNSLSGGTAGSTPTDTAAAAINIAHYPAAKTSALFALQSGVAMPFQPALTAAPNDFSVSLVYTGGGLATPATVAVHDLAVDGSGNIWSVVPASNIVAEFSPQGAVLQSVSTSTANGLSGPISVAIDTATPANAWIINNVGKTVSEISTVDGSTIGNYTLLSSGTNVLSGPSDGEFDGSGNLWITNYTSSSIVKAATTSTSATFTATATNTTYIKSTEGIALSAGAAGSVWAGTGSAKYASQYTNADVYSLSTTLTASYAFATAVDASGNVWYAESTKDIAKVLPGTTLNRTEIATVQSKDYYYPTYYSLSLDGAGNVFLPDTSNGVLQEFTSAAVNASVNGFIPAGEPSNYVINAVAPPTGYVRPFTVVMDGSGNAWYNTLTDATLREVVGIGVPVATPLAYGVANSLLGTRP
jgi:hypothetical protein